MKKDKVVQKPFPLTDLEKAIILHKIETGVPSYEPVKDLATYVVYYFISNVSWIRGLDIAGGDNQGNTFASIRSLIDDYIESAPHEQPELVFSDRVILSKLARNQLNKKPIELPSVITQAIERYLVKEGGIELRTRVTFEELNDFLHAEGILDNLQGVQANNPITIRFMEGLGYKFKVTCDLHENINFPEFVPSFILESELDDYEYQRELYYFGLLGRKRYDR